ncbi:SPOR domain-containing protein [Paracoccus sp. TK19116]|uniref:SPOR domain-containing protein n=1 Tax=Paracoccus albicereus TaxID=2922394 RepID=A0ABT1MTG1_9RHOB|nr:SPOR domain-containing protein [Paracoccus albicereus]MCQ0971582.1 SPOR domain-containing protein [Paracoccus albicereus]
MAVMDFRDGGFGFTRSRQRARRNEDFEQFGWDEQDAEDAPRDHRRFAANPSVEDLPSRLGRLTHYLGAVLSVGLMVGLLGWGWQLVMRDVSGVPVIAALQGEARTSPEEPGGELTGHTGLAVNDVAEGVARTPADEVAIAPETTGLDDSDVAMGALGATAREPLVDSETPLNFEGAPEIAMTNAQLAAAEEARAAAEAAALAVEAAQVSDAPAAEGAVTSAVTDENGQIAEPDAINEALAQAQRPIAAPEADTVATGSVQVSARPAPRPRRAAVAAPVQTVSATPAPAAASRPASRDQAVAPAAPAPAPAPVQTASASGGPQVQIGAFDSDAIAASEWGRVSGKHGSLFSGKGQVIQKHESNGRTFWRLRVAGFGSRDEARQFCKALIDAGTDCIPAGQ